MCQLRVIEDVKIVVSKDSIYRKFSNKNLNNYFVVLIELTNLSTYSQFYDIKLSDLIIQELYNDLKKQLPYVFFYSLNQLVIISEFKNKTVINQLLRTNEQETLVSNLMSYIKHKKFQYDSKEQYYQIQAIAGSGSVGMRDELPTIDALIKLAHFTMLEAKNNNLDYKIATEETRIIKADVDDFNHEIEQGITYDEFSPHYLPIINLQSMKIIGVESLLRWEKDEYRIIEAGKFKQIATEKNLFNKLDRIIIEKSFHDYQTWIKKDLIDITFVLTININRQTLLSLHIPELNALLERYNMNQENIEFDISEHDMLDKQVLDAVRRLKDAKFKVSIDAFYSSTNAFHSMINVEMNTIKVDRNNLPTNSFDEYNYRFYQTIIKLSETMDFNVMSKGIESKQQLETAKHLDIKFAQGYYFTPPLNSIKILGYLNKYRNGILV